MPDGSKFCVKCGYRIIGTEMNDNNQESGPQVYHTDKPVKQNKKHNGIIIFLIILAVIIAIGVLIRIGSTQDAPDINEYTSDNEDTTEDSIEQAVLESSVVYDGHGVTISTQGIEYGSSDVTISFLVENNSESDYSFSAHAYDINGVMMGDHAAGSEINVPVGKKDILDVTVDYEDLEFFGIDTISEVNVIFWAYGEYMKEWDTGLLHVHTNLYNEGYRISANEPFDYEDEAVNVKYVDYDGYDVYFIVENKTDYCVTCTFDNCAINDWAYKITDYNFDAYDELINAHSLRVIVLSVDPDYIDNKGITSIDEISFDISISDNNWNYEGDLYEHRTGKIVIGSEE